MILVLILSILSPSHADSSWFCTEATSKRIGNTIEACGVSNDLSEDVARAKAFDNAKNEFEKICELSIDCKGKKFTLTPQRNECIKSNGQIECRRMLEFTIEDTQNANALPINPQASIELDMSLKELVGKFGNPDELVDFTHTTGINKKLFYYINKPWCVRNGRCSVFMLNDRVEHYDSFKIEYTDALLARESPSFWQQLKKQLGFTN